MNKSNKTYIAAFDIGASKIAAALISKDEHNNNNLIAFDKEILEDAIIRCGDILRTDQICFHIEALRKKLANAENININKAYISFAGKKYLDKNPTAQEKYTIIKQDALEKELELIETETSRMSIMSEYLLTQEEKRSAYLLIDFGASSTSYIAQNNDGKVYESVIRAGAHNITKDLKYLELTTEEAERLKKKLGNALKSLVSTPKKRIQLPDKGNGIRYVELGELSRMIEERMMDILMFINKDLQKHLNINNFACNIIITGGGAYLNNIQALLQQLCGFNIRITDGLSLLTDTDNAKIFNRAEYTALACILANGKVDCSKNLKQTNKPKSTKPGIIARITGSMTSIFSDEGESI